VTTFKQNPFNNFFVKHKNIAAAFVFVLAGSITFFFSCKKINEATTLGGDLIPVVDNVNTFDTTLDVLAYNDVFTNINDSSSSAYTDVQYLGQITNDPLFGKTDARMFLQLKPASFKHAFLNRPDSLELDSIVLVLSYVNTYGDTVQPQNVRVFEIAQSSSFKRTALDSVYNPSTQKYEKYTYDTAYKYRQSNIAYQNPGMPLGQTSFIPYRLNDSVKVFKDTTAKQLRIKLSNTFGRRLLDYDSSIVNGRIDAYSSDSAFNSQFKGFALEATGGNSVVGFSLTSVNTKLAIYYKDKGLNRPQADWDTVVTYFPFSTSLSASANYIQRDYTGTSWYATAGDNVPDNSIFIQNTPGTFAKVSVPGLAGLNSRVVHMAQLIVEQDYTGITDSLFYAPLSMMLDAWDPAVSKFRTIPYDLLMGSNNALDYTSFGTYPRNSLNDAGQNIKVWKFNLTRYVQHVVTDRLPVYDFRLYSPTFVRLLYGIPSVTGDISSAVQPLSPVISTIGRVKLYGGGNGALPNANPRRMRLRIVYSKI
jgi:hypothetical protein